MRFPQIFTIAIAVTLIPLSITSTSYAQAHTKGRKVAPLTSALKPGDYVWHPELAPAGPVVGSDNTIPCAFIGKPKTLPI